MEFETPQSLPIDIEDLIDPGHTPNLNSELIELINTGEINPNSRTKDTDLNLLHLACKHGNLDLVRYLLNLGTPDPNASGLGRFGYTPLYLACQPDNASIVRLLMRDPRVEINATMCGSSYITALYTCCENGYEHLCAMLLSRKDIVVCDEYQKTTPLHAACYGDHSGILKKLIDVTGNANLTDINGKTPLHIACEYGSYDCVDLLTRIPGVLVDISDSECKTPLYIAVENGFVECANLMLRRLGRKLDVHKRSIDGVSIFDVCRTRSLFSVLRQYSKMANENKKTHSSEQ